MSSLENIVGAQSAVSIICCNVVSIAIHSVTFGRTVYDRSFLDVVLLNLYFLYSTRNIATEHAGQHDQHLSVTMNTVESKYWIFRNRENKHGFIDIGSRNGVIFLRGLHFHWTGSIVSAFDLSDSFSLVLSRIAPNFEMTTRKGFETVRNSGLRYPEILMYSTFMWWMPLWYYGFLCAVHV